MKKIIVTVLTTFLLGTNTNSNAQFVQQGNKLVGIEAVDARQGSSVSISGDGNTAIVGGAYDNNDTGAAWIYTRSGGAWTQQGNKLIGAGAIGVARQGGSVSISGDGNTAIVGGAYDNNDTGAVWIYTRSGGAWTQQGSKLVGAGTGGSALQGSSVSISGDGNTAIVGGFYDDNQEGAAWVYTRSGSIWTQQGNKLVGIDATYPANQGSSVALSADGNTAIVGGVYDNNWAGAAWVYIRSGGVWTQQGNKLVGTGAVNSGSFGAFQGSSVSLSSDGNTAIVGGSGDDGSIGAAWVYTRSGGVWTQQGNKLVDIGAGSVSISGAGNTVIIGGPSAYGTGAVSVYTRSGGVWTQLGSELVGTGAIGGAGQGGSVSISSDGNTVIVGGSGDNNNTGAAWVFVASGGSVGISEAGNPDMFSISPNPCTTCEIHGVTDANDITVTDILGRTVNASFTKTSDGFSINLAGSPTGIYLVRNRRTGEAGKVVRE